MVRALDIASLVLLLGAGAAFTAGVLALGSRRDLVALYWFGVGALALRAAVDLVRPRSGGR
jgi:hypothetical protein